MQKNLFLGWGKVAQAIARTCDGHENIIFWEESGDVRSAYLRDGRLQDETNSRGNFDDIEWTEYLPARVFLSPGIDPRRSFFKTLKDYECREISYVRERFRGFFVGITGTDGKSTFTSQLGEVMKRAFPDKKIFVGGNLGRALGELLLEDFDIAVVELSSFQCERWASAILDVGVILNIAPDHLDRYDSFDDYARQKWNLIAHSKMRFFPSDLRCPVAAWKSETTYANDDELTDLLTKVAPRIVQGFSPAMNFNPVWLENLPTLPHRLEVWKSQDDVMFVNDSKATTVHAAIYALRRLQSIRPVVKLVLGGRPKGDDFSLILKELRVGDCLYYCGEAADIIEEALGSLSVKSKRYKHMADLWASEIPHVTRHEAFLLSPACSSYDEFQNFEERGKSFLNAVVRLRGELKKDHPVFGTSRR